MTENDDEIDAGRFTDDFPEFLSFFGGPFYRAVNATAAYVAAYTATALAQILSGSLLLGCLKWSLFVAFGCRAFQVVLPDDKMRTDGCLVSGLKMIGVFLLLGAATMASQSAIDAGLVQLDGDRSAKAAKAERVARKWRKIGIAAGCYDPDHSDPKVCTEISQRMRMEVDAVKNGSEPPPPAAHTAGTAQPRAPANR